MKKLMLLSVLGFSLMAAPAAHAQPVEIGIGIGVAPVYVGPPPVCPYGYYPYYPYACAPYGYYGPEWFVSGVFIGAGPWFHGFYGRPGIYARPGFAGHPVYRGGVIAPGPVANGFRGSAPHAPIGRAPAGNGFRGGSAHPALNGAHGGRGM